MGGCKEDGDRCFSVVYSDKRQWAQLKKQEIPPEHMKKLILLQMWSNTGSACTKMLWSLHHNLSYGGKTQLDMVWLTMLKQEIKTKRSLPTSAVLWFCGTTPMNFSFSIQIQRFF